MAVEHRWSNRKEVTLDIHLYYPPVGMVIGKTRNISLEGMFVELKGITIPPLVRLEVSFSTAANGRQIEHRLPAQVIHSSEGGVGLMLQHAGHGAFGALRYMLNAA
jgi:hypothetical protein